VFFESIVRGQYIAFFLDDAKIDAMYTNPKKWKSLQITEMCKDLDSYFKVDMFDKIREQNYGTMCDYTHIGYNQIARHFNEEKCTIEPNFDTALIIDMLKGNHILLEFFAKNFIAFMESRNGK